MRKGEVFDKATVNEMTNTLATSGSRLIVEIDSLCQELFSEKGDEKFNYGILWANGNLGVALFVTMTVYAQNGGVPIDVDRKGECYYDMLSIERAIQNYKPGLLKEEIAIIKAELIKNDVSLKKVPYYDMLRNFIHTVSIVYVKYLEKIESKLGDIMKRINKVITSCPELVVKTGDLHGNIVYMVEGEEQVNTLNTFEHIMVEFYQDKEDARNHFEECSYGRIEK